jgi:hypothetical protein
VMLSFGVFQASFPVNFPVNPAKSSASLKDITHSSGGAQFPTKLLSFPKGPGVTETLDKSTIIARTANASLTKRYYDETFDVAALCVNGVPRNICRNTPTFNELFSAMLQPTVVAKTKMLLPTIVESARSIPYGGINLLEIMYSLPTISP